MKNTAGEEQMMMVAANCSGYEAISNAMTNSIGGCNSKSCSNCKHWSNQNCSINLFDSVLTSVDQT
ncbi:hypothetical protein SAMN05428976_11738 [Clostridium sp. USBA 49]|uniref:hypothetical protein n=1 Tax=Clostridium TaxID=1485 RepID=UPI000999033E|nr:MULTISPECIES: hypothetical protein [Clostridium]SKA91619.1 hypothetical protein SAMN05428976_11738 [Clostridium sp. USBA 49]